MKVSSRFFLIALLAIALATVLSACQFLDEVVPTVLPPVRRGEPTSSSPTVDQSPRVRDAQDVPPTWTPAPTARSESPISPELATTLAPGSQATYTVQAGDTLAEIATRFNVTLEALAVANNIEDYDHIEVGQVLIVPGAQ